MLVGRLKSLQQSGPSADLESSIDAVRERVETMSKSEAAPLLRDLIPIIVSLMNSVPPSFAVADPKHSCRLSTLRCLSRLITLEEPVKPYLNDISGIFMDCLVKDNEECALLSLHAIIDLQKTFRHLVEPMVPPFLDFVISLLDRFEQIAREPRQPGKLCPSQNSLKIVLECPVIVVLIFQLHRRFINDYIGRFVPVVMKALAVTIEAPSDTLYPPTITSDNHSTTPKAIHCDFLSAKIKVLSFFAYISRGFIAAVRQSANDIPVIVMDLLKETPCEIPSARKELLVAIRHILSTEIRVCFVPFLGAFLDERLLLGEGWTCQVFFRPLAYSLLADLIHHVRLDLAQKHLVQIINLYCRLLSDPSLPAGIQTMSAKLLLNLIDPVMAERVEKPLKKILLNKILSALLFRATSLARLVTSGFGIGADNGSFPFYTYPDDPSSVCQLVTTSDSITTESWREGPKECKFMLKTILSSIKAVILAGKSAQEGSEPALGMTLVEAQSFVAFFADGLECLRLLPSYSATPLDPKSSRAFSVSSIPAEDKELLDQFAYIFTLLDLPLFYDIVERSMAGLVSATRHNFALLAIPQYFLAISGLSKHFSSILARFLVDRMSVLGQSNGDGFADLDAAIHLRLFKLLFLSVSVYPEENEPVLQPFVGEIIMQCLRGRQSPTCSGSSGSIHYFYLLRSLFRSIGGGRFESLYKEVLPLLPLILEELNRLIFDRDLSMDTVPSSREVYVELCLTVPVRLSVLLPYLPLLMRPLVLSLSSSSELIGQGLRTLELCVDNLTQDFLDPVITPIADDLMRALWRLLQPSPSVIPAHAQVAMRVLGKLGGRSRRLGRLLTMPNLQADPVGNNVRLELDLGTKQRGMSIELSVDFAIEHAAGILNDHCLPANQPFLPAALSIVRHFILSSVSKVPSSSTIPSTFHDCTESVDQGSRHRQLFKTCLLSLFKAVEGDCCQEPAEELLSCVFGELFSQFRQLEGVRSGMSIVEDGRMLTEVLIMAAAAASSSLDNQQQSLAQRLIESQVLANICTTSPNGTPSAVSPIAQLFFDRLMSFCYESAKMSRLGLSAVLFKVCSFAIANTTSDDASGSSALAVPVWIGPIATRLLRSLLYLLKDTTNQSAVLLASNRLGHTEQLIVDRISQSVYKLLKACMRSGSPPQLLSEAPLENRLQASVSQSVTVLVAELSCPNATVREVVQSSFQLIADARGVDVTELLLPYRDRFLPPIFTKPLRALPFSMQIGHIDAVTFCLGLRPPLIGWSEELLRMLQEVLALAETDDHNLLGKSGQLKNTVVLVGLRVVCIRFLATCLPIADLQNQKHAVIRNHIVSVFFKSLYSRSAEVVEVARKGLELVVVNQSKLPKDLLQLGLRPVLMNLAEAKRLTLAGLEGLSRVLQLLTSYFKAEIGRKLLDHLAVWAEPKMLEESKSRNLMDVPDVKIIAAILAVFPLLPASANVFVPEVVKVVADLEVQVVRRASSPFRAPLFAFLQKYPTEAGEVLSENINNPTILSFFSDLLFSQPPTQATAQIAKEWMAKAANRVVASIAQQNQPPLVRLEYLRILVGLAQQPGRLLTGARLFRELIGTLWSNLDILIRKDAALIIGEEEVDLMMSLSRLYIQCNPADSEFVFAWLALIRPPLPCDPSFLPTFLCTTWLPLCSQQEMTKVLKLWLSFCMNPDVPVYSKALVTRLIAVPVVQMCPSAVDTTLLSAVRGQVWAREGRTGPFGVWFIMSELQFTASLVWLFSQNANSSSGLQKYKKDISDFLLNRAAIHDPVIKVLSLALFAELNPTLVGDDLVLSMAKSANLETRAVVKAALLCVLRVAGPGGLGAIRSFLDSDSISIPAILSIWMAICEQPALLQSSISLQRSLIMSFCRFGQSVMAVPEQKIYGPKLLLLMIDNQDSQLVQCAAIHLLKLCGSLMDSGVDAEAARQCAFDFLSAALRVSNPRVILGDADFGGFERIAANTNSSNTTTSANTLGTPAIMTPSQPTTVTEDVSDMKTAVLFLSNLLEPFLLEGDTLMAFLSVLSNCGRLFEAFLSVHVSHSPLPITHRLIPAVYQLSGQFAGCKTKIDQLLSECLSGVKLVPTVPLIIQEELSSIMSTTTPDTLMNSMSRLVQKLTKEMTCGGPGFDPLNEHVFVELTRLMLERVDAHLHLKAGLVSCMMAVWGRVGLAVCHRFILSLITRSLLSDAEGGARLPVKECVDFLKAGEGVFSGTDRELVRSFYDTVAAIFTQANQLRTTDTLAQLQPVFLCGLLERDALVRERMQNILLTTLSPSLGNMFCQLLVGLDWSTIGARFWLRSVVSITLQYLTTVQDGVDPVHVCCRALFDPVNPTLTTSPSSIALLAQSVGHSGYSLLTALSTLAHHQDSLARSFFIHLFPAIWSLLTGQQRADLDAELVKMLSKPELLIQRYMRPNVPETILEAAAHCSSPVGLSPQLIKYLGQHYCGWYSSAVLLEQQCEVESDLILTETNCQNGTAVLWEKAQVALGSLLERLGDEDMWYGVMRRRAVFPETVLALSFAQAGQWPTSQSAIESTLQKARNGSIGYLSSEYGVWERMWCQSAKALQQWDFIGEVAKMENDAELQLEAMWHSADWSSSDTVNTAVGLLKAVSGVDVRKKCVEGLLLLEQLRESPDKLARFHSVVEEAMALGMKEWWQLPGRPFACHALVLESFQSIVELQESQLVFCNLSLPHPPQPQQHRQPFLQELKGLLGTWRDRLPNHHDRLSVWSDVLAWRQHVYSALSTAFHTASSSSGSSLSAAASITDGSSSQPHTLTASASTGTGTGTGTSQQHHPLAFRGYHETAWLINRFAKVCRKNGLLDVCLQTLNRIYTLPNIEIQDAFLKLREQTKCYMTEANDLPLALEVVNATNLNYFNASQKAEFFTIKAVVYMRLGMLDEANKILAQAVQIDLNLPKGWAVWAGYNDLRFQQSNDRTFAVNAINCYLQAASLHKSAKCRKFLARVLWLSTFEDDAGTVLKPFELYAAELPVWYWLFFIPQLITSLNRKEYRQARYLLIKIAKTFPQALYSTLRAAIEDYRVAQPVKTEGSSGVASPPLPSATSGSDGQNSADFATQSPDPSASPSRSPSTVGTPRKSAAEEADDIMAILKTAYPLLTLSIENLVDHLVNRLRASPDEDVFRILTTLHTEACQQLALSMGTNGSDDVGTPFRMAVDASLKRVSFMISSFPYLQQRYKDDFDAEFVHSQPSLPEVVKGLRRWKARLEETVSALPSTISIDTLSRYLSEFEHQKYDDVEIPGQYLTVPLLYVL